jgi:hypothetical protein
MHILSTAAQRFIGNCLAAARPTPPQAPGPTRIGQPSPPRTGLSSFFSFRGASTYTLPPHVPLQQLREEMLAAIVDCPERARGRITISLYRAQTGLELWLIRSDIFQCVSRERGQEEARRRVNALRPGFAKHIPKKQLVAI